MASQGASHQQYPLCKQQLFHLDWA